MELSFDSVGFQRLFQRRPRGLAERSRLPVSPIHALAKDGVIVEAFSDSEDLQSWIGARVEDFRQQLKNRDVYVYDEDHFDLAWEESLSAPNYFQQMERMRSELRTLPLTGEKEGKRFVVDEHFLVEALRGGWNRVLPSSYGLFVRVQESRPHGENQDFVLIVKRGELSAFHRPDFSFLSAERRGSHEDLVKYLSEKYLVPIQGLFVPETDWLAWMEGATPWRLLAESVRANRSQLIPFRWSVMTLVATRAFLRL